MATFRCVVAVPTEKLFDQDVYYANVPSIEGQFGVLPGHELLVSLTQKGGLVTLNLDESGTKQESFLLYEGATQMYNGILTVLGVFGKNVKDIDIDEMEARAAKERDYIKELEANPDDIQDKIEIETSKELVEWCELQIEYAKGNLSAN